MRLQINFHHLDSTPSLQSKIEQKVEKLEKFFGGELHVIWTCTVDKQGQHSHVEVRGNGFDLNATSNMEDLYKTFDDVLQKLQKQLSKVKEQRRDHIHHKHDHIEQLRTNV